MPFDLQKSVQNVLKQVLTTINDLEPISIAIGVQKHVPISLQVQEPLLVVIVENHPINHFKSLSNP